MKQPTLKLFLLLIGFLFVPNFLQAATYVWDGGGDGTTWTDENNWDLNSNYPGLISADNDLARIPAGSTYTVSLPVSATIQELEIGDDVTLNLTGSGPKLTVTTTVQVLSSGAASMAIIQGVGSLITGGGNNATSFTLDDATNDSLYIKELELQNGTATLTLATNSVVTVDTAMTWTNGDLTLSNGVDFYHPGFILPTGETMTCNNAQIFSQGTWTFDGTFTEGTSELIWIGDGSIAGSTAPTIHLLTINAGSTLTGSTNFSVENTWDNNGVFTDSSNTVTVTTTLTLQGTGTNEFNDLTINGSQTLTLSGVDDSTIDIQDTLTINGILSCGGSNTITVDGTWDNNNGASGFNEGSDPASTAEGSRVVFGGTTANMPDVDETFMDLEIRSSVSAVANAHYTVNRTWFGTTDKFSPSTFTVTFDTSLEHLNGATPDRGILKGTGTFNVVHIVEGDTSASPNKRLIAGAIMKAASIHIDNSYFVMQDSANIQCDAIVISTGATFETTTTSGTPTIQDRGSQFSFNVRGSADLEIAGLNVKNPDNNGMVIESTSNQPSTFTNIAFTDENIGSNGTYLNYQRTNDTGGGPNWDGHSFDANCQYNLRTVAAYGDTISMRSFGGAKGGDTYENDNDSGTVAGGSIEWDVFYWTGANDNDFNDSNNWYPSGGPPSATETGIVSTDNLAQCQINVNTSVGALIIKSGGVVTNDANRSLTVGAGGLFIEADTGDGAGQLVHHSTGSLTVNGNLENNGILASTNAMTVALDFTNSGTFRNQDAAADAVDIGGGFSNLSGGVVHAGGGTWVIDGNFVNAGTFNRQTSTVSLRGSTVTLTSGGSSFYNLEFQAQASLALEATATDALDITNELQFDNTNNTNLLELQGALTFTGGVLQNAHAGGAGGTIEYAATSAQSIAVPPSGGTNYYTLLVSNTHASGAKFLSGTTTADNSFTIADGGVGGANASANFRLTGNWTNNGTYSASVGKVIFAGAATRTIGGDTVSTFNDLNVENATTLNVNVTEVGRTNEFEVAGTFRNDGTFTAGTSTAIFTGTPAGDSLEGVSTTTFDTVKITGTFNAGSDRFGVANTFWNAGTFNYSTSKVHFTGSNCQITGTTTFYAITLDAATLTLGAADDVTITERFAVWANSTFTLADNPTLRLSKGMRVYGTMSADGATPTITDTGTDFAFSISGSSASVDINKLNFTNPDNSGLVLETDVTNANIDLDNIAFTNDDLSQTGIYINLKQTTIAANTFFFSGCSFDNNCQYNLQSDSNAGVAAAAISVTGYSGARSGSSYENDKLGGQNDTGTSSINWPSKAWVGGTSQSWSLAGNWSPASVPGASDTVLIPKVAAGNKTPIIDSSNVTIVSLTINSGAVLTRDNSVSTYTFRVTSNLDIKPDSGDGVGNVTFEATGSSSFQVDGDLTNRGVLNNSSATLQINGSLDNYGYFVNSGATFNISGDMDNQSGAYLSSGDALTVDGGWTNDSSAEFSPGTGTVTFNGTGNIASGGDAFYKVSVLATKSPTATDAFSLTNILSVRGTLNLQNSITFGSRFDEWTGKIKFTSTAAQTVPQETYYDIEVDKSSGTATLASGSTSTALGSVTLTNGTLDASNATLNIEGNIVNNATFTASTSTIVFTKSGSQEVQGSNQTDFYNLQIDSGATLKFNNTDSPANESNVANDWTNNGAFTASDAQITFTGASSSVLGTATTTFDKILIDSTGTLDVANTANELHVGTTFTNNGSYTTGTTTVKCVGTGTWAGSSATIVKTLEVIDSMTFGAGDDVTVTTFTIWNSGSFTINGNGTVRFTASGALDLKGSMTLTGTTPTITSTPTSVQWSFTVQDSGSLDINAANLDNNGILIQNSASTSVDIDGANFTDATSGATGIYINWQKTGATAGLYTFSGCSFDTNCQFNIRSNSDAAVGAFTITGYGGAKGGSSFEDDHETGAEDATASSTIDWPSVVWDGETNSNWNTATNWAPDGVPGSTDNVKIPSVPSVNLIFPSLNTTTTIGSLIVEDGASVTSDGGARSLTITGSLEIEVDAGAGSDAVVTWDSTGTLQVDGQLTLNGRLDLHTGGGTLDLNSGVTLGAGADLFSANNGVIDIEGNLTSSGEVKPEVMTVAGNFDTSGGTFTMGTSVVTLDGASGTVDVGSDSFYRLSIPSGSEYTSDGTNTLTVGNRLTVGGILNVAGPFTMSGTLDPITGTVRYSGSGTQTIAALNYYDLQVTNTDNNVTFAVGTSSVANDFTIANNATCLGSSALVQVTGDWINNHTFTAGTSTVSLDGAASSINGDSKTTFNNLFIASGATVDVDTTASPADEIELTGNWTNDGTFTTGTSHIIFNGTSIVRGATVTTFDDITISATKSLSLAGVNRFDWGGDFTDNGTFTAGTSTIGTTEGAGKTLAGSASDTVFINLHVLGTLTVSAKTFTVETLNVWGTGVLDIQGSMTLSLGSSGTKGAANIRGSFQASGSTPKVTAKDTAQEYSFDVLGGGTVDIDAMTFDYPDNDGIHINSDASTTFDIDSVSFTNGNTGAGGRYMKIDLASIAADSYSFSSLSIDANCEKNIQTPASASDSAVTCPGWGGARGGEDYEDDKSAGTIASGGSITWPQKQWDGSTDSKWSDATNWTPSGVPTAGDNVEIPSGLVHYPWLNLTTSIGSLSIKNNTVVTAAGTGSLTISGGVEIDAPSGGSDLSGVLTWDSSGTLSIGSTLDVNGHMSLNHASATISVAGSTTVGASNGWLRAIIQASSFDIDGNLTNNGVFDPESVTVGGNWVNDGTFTNGTGTVTLDGVTGTIDTNTQNFNNLFISSGSTYTAQNENIAVDAALVVPGTLKVSTALTFGTMFNEETGTIEFTGTSAQTVPQEVYYNLTLSTTGGNASLGSSFVQVVNDITVGGSSTVTCDTYALWVSGDLVNNGTFYAGSGSVSFCGASSQVQGSGQSDFHDLYIQSAGSLTFNNSSGNDPVVESSFINNGTFTASTSTVAFSGNATALKGTSITTFDNLSISSSSSLQIRINGSNHNHVGIKSTFTNNGTLTFSSNDGNIANRIIFPSATGVLAGSTATVLDLVEVYGTLTLGTGDDLTTKALLVSGGTLSLGGTSTLRLGTATRPGAITSDQSSATINSSGTPTITDMGADFNFIVQNSGVVALNGGTLQNMDDNGLDIKSTAGTALDIDGITFANDDNDDSSGIYIQVRLAAIATNTYTWESCVFNSGALYNVQTQSVAGTPAINMSGWSGGRGGSTYENDEGAGQNDTGTSSVDWPEKTWDGSASSLWGTAANWTPSGVPGAGERAVIPSGLTHYPYFNGSFSVGSIAVKSGGSVTNSGTTNNITINGSIEVEYDTGSGQGALTFDATSGALTANSVTSDGTLTASNNTFTVGGDVRNTKWMNNAATLLDINGDLTNTSSAAYMIAGRINLTGAFTNSSGAQIDATSSVITFDGASQQNINVNSASLAQLHATGSGTVAFQEPLTITTGLSVNSGTVTFSNVTVTLSNGALVDVSSLLKFDNTLLSNAGTGFKIHINSGGDIWAKQTTRFDRINDEGMIFRTGSKMGSNTTLSNGTTNFRYVTFDNITATGTGIDMSGLVAGDADSFPDVVREIRFNGSAGGVNVKIDADTDPKIILRLFTGDFGTLATNGEDADSEPGPSNRIYWITSTNYVSLESFKAMGWLKDSADRSSGPEPVADDLMELQWETIVEISNLGFNLYRSENKNGPFIKLNESLIAPGGPQDGMTGYAYSYTDLLPDRGEIFYYKLEDVDEDGTRTFHGPICTDWDRDGMPDDWETSNGFDHLDSSDAAGDVDNDGLSNLDEFRFGQDPHNPDTDGDGILDGDEDLNIYDGSVAAGLMDPLLAGGSGLRVVGQDPLGVTLEFEIDGILVEQVNRSFSGYVASDSASLWTDKWKPWTFNTLRFDGLPSEYQNVTGLPRLPVKRALLNLPVGRIPRIRILDEVWGDDIQLSLFVEPVSRVEDRPTSIKKKKKLKKIIKSTKTVVKDFSSESSYERKVRSWASLFMSKKRYEREFLQETKQLTEQISVEEEIVEEIEVSEPSTALVDIYEMNSDIYPQTKPKKSPYASSASNKSGIDPVKLTEYLANQGFAPKFGSKIKATVGDLESTLLTLQPLSYDPTTGVIRHVKKIRFRVDYIWDPTIQKQNTVAWKQKYALINANKPAFLNYDKVVEIRIRKPAYANAGDLNDSGIYKVTVADLNNAGLDTTSLVSDPSRLRLFCGMSELSLKEESGAWLFFADSGLFETLYNDRVVLYAVDDSAQSGKRWSSKASESSFDQQVTSFNQTIRFERNGTFSPIYMERTPDSFFVHPSSSYKTQNRVYNFEVPGFLPSSTALIRSRLWGGYDFEPDMDQGAYLRLNSDANPFATAQWPGRTFKLLSGQIDTDDFTPGTNQFRLQGYLPNGIPKTRVRLDWFDVTYPRQLIAKNNHLLIADALPAGSNRLQVTGFSNPSTISVLDVSDSGDVKEVTGAVLGGDSLTFNFKNVNGADSVLYPNFLRLDSDYGTEDPRGRGNFGFGVKTYAPNLDVTSIGVSVDDLSTSGGGVSMSAEILAADASIWSRGDRVIDPEGRYGLTGYGPYFSGVAHQGTRVLLTDLSSARSIESATLVDLSVMTPVRDRSSAVDHLIIVDESLLTEATRLRDHLSDQVVAGADLGSTRKQIVELVTFQQLMREYTHGFYSAAAMDLYIKERFRTADVWDGAEFIGKPRHVTVVGSGNINTKGIWGFASEKPLIPTVVMRGGIKAAAADGTLVLVTDDDYQDLAISRIDVGTNLELANYVDKVVDYDSRMAQENPRAILVADRDSGSSEALFADSLDKSLHSFELPWAVSRLYRTELTAAQITQGIQTGLNNDSISLLVYNGHGNFTAWGSEIYWNTSSFGSLTSGHWLPLVIEANCLSSDWFHLNPRSLGTTWIQQVNKGAIAVIGTTGRSTTNDKENVLLFSIDNLTRRGHRSFGEALRRAKLEALTLDAQDPNRAIISQHLLGVSSQELK